MAVDVKLAIEVCRCWTASCVRVVSVGGGGADCQILWGWSVLAVRVASQVHFALKGSAAHVTGEWLEARVLATVRD